MTCKSLPHLLLASALLIASADYGVAQIEMQQRNGSQNGSNATGSRSRADAAAAIRGPGLAMVPADFAQLKIAPGFLLGLNVLDDPDFTGAFRIDEQGDIVLPVLGTLHVGGETISEARVQIGKKLFEEKILQNPQVDLSIQEYTAPEVTIIGEVASPGKYPLLAPRKLVDVLALAGGTTITAGNEIQILPGDSSAASVMIHYSRATNPKEVQDAVVHPGDTVQVKRAGIIYVLGAVTRPGGYVMQEEGTLTVLQAIALANGTAVTASTRTIYLLRRNADGTEVDIALPYKKIAHGGRADIPLRATDLLYVPTSTFKAVLTNSQGILASAASASIYAVAVY